VDEIGKIPALSFGDFFEYCGVNKKLKKQKTKNYGN
jgi:hypothetical protein